MLGNASATKTAIVPMGNTATNAPVKTAVSRVPTYLLVKPVEQMTNVKVASVKAPEFHDNASVTMTAIVPMESFAMDVSARIVV